MAVAAHLTPVCVCVPLAALQEEVVLAIDGHTGLASGPALGGADQDTADAIHAMEVLSLEGSGRGRALLRPMLANAGVGVAPPY